jgi:hypothetical protein
MSARRTLLIGSIALIAFAFTATASAGWIVTGTGSSYGKAQALGAGNTPTVSVSGRNVTVSWAATSGGAPVGGYVVKRYDTSNNLQTIGTACTGTIAGLTCIENAVPAGGWKYTVTPAQASWRGTESAKSATATVAAAALTINSPSTNALPTTFAGQITNFISGQTVTYRLDDPSSGTVLTGSIVPSPVPTNGTATVSVTIPAGTANGTHTIYAVGSAGDQPGASITINRPQIGTSVIAKSQGGHASLIKQGGTYFIYANATGTGNPPAGLSTLTANVSNVTTGQTTVAMTNGSYSVDNNTYNYRSAQLTANASLSAGPKSYSLTLTDTAGSTTSSNFSVTVVNTIPTASDIQTHDNNTIVGQAQITDTITYTFSEPIEPFSILAGWDGSSTPVVVRITHGLLALGNDGVEIYNSANSAVLPYGQVDLGRNDYVNGVLGGRLDFGASGTASTMVMSGNSVTVTLGTRTTVGALVSAGTASGTGTMTWNPVATPYDYAANPMSTASVNQSGGPAREF